MKSNAVKSQKFIVFGYMGEDLTSSFKAAANSVTLLYKESISQVKKAKENGYKQCLQDLKTFISHSPNMISIAELESFFNQKLNQLQSESFEEKSSFEHLHFPHQMTQTSPMVSMPNVTVGPSESLYHTLHHESLESLQDSHKRRWEESLVHLDMESSKKSRIHHTE